MERLLTLTQVSQILGSTDTSDGRFVRNLVKNQELACARIGKRLMFRESDVEEFINRKFKQQNKKKSSLGEENSNEINTPVNSLIF